MDFEDLKNLYHEMQREKDGSMYRHIPELLQRAEELHRTHHI